MHSILPILTLHVPIKFKMMSPNHSSLQFRCVQSENVHACTYCILLSLSFFFVAFKSAGWCYPSPQTRKLGRQQNRHAGVRPGADLSAFRRPKKPCVWWNSHNQFSYPWYPNHWMINAFKSSLATSILIIVFSVEDDEAFMMSTCITYTVLHTCVFGGCHLTGIMVTCSTVRESILKWP